MQKFRNNETMTELFLIEINQLIEQLEMIIIQCEEEADISTEDINHIFRIMHTTKGSSAMMGFQKISDLSHSIEDLFFYIRENKEVFYDFGKLYKLVLDYIDFIKDEIAKLERGETPDGESSKLINRSKALLKEMDNTKNTVPKKQKERAVSAAEEPQEEGNYYCVRVMFDHSAGMENVRGHLLLYSLQELISKIIVTIPKDLDIENNAEIIKNEGFFFCVSSHAPVKEFEKIITETSTVEQYKIIEVKQPPRDLKGLFIKESIGKKNKEQKSKPERQQNYISVHSDKLNQLMDLVGELVISESMVTNNPDLAGLSLDNFNKSAHQLRKLINELRDVVVDIRMLPIAVIFQKMNRIIRDMSKKLGKEIEFVVSGEDTQMDKSVIDILSEPIMHLIRNAADHGIEMPEERIKANKPATGRISLKAWQNNNYAFVQVVDDGIGLNKEQIYEKAKGEGLVSKSFEEIPDKELFSCLLSAGFSTKSNVTEFSGRGVGLDVVKKNIELVGGNITIDSSYGNGTIITLRIPLTLLILNVMHLKMGHMSMAVPIRSIYELRRAKNDEVVTDQEGNEMLVLRGECIPILRLSKFFDIPGVTSIEDGILLLVEDDHHAVCLFADGIVGEQQVVVKPLPSYIKNTKGILGCTIQNDGSLCLILDMNEILNTCWG